MSKDEFEARLAKENRLEKCLSCGYEFKPNEVFNDDLGWFAVCPNCESSFDIDVRFLDSEYKNDKRTEGVE